MGDFCAAHYSEMAVTQNGCKLMHIAAGAAERYGSALQHDFHCQTAAQTLQFSCISAAQRSGSVVAALHSAARFNEGILVGL